MPGYALHREWAAKNAAKSHQVYQSAAQNGMQFAYATNSCSDKRVLLGQGVVLIDVPIADVSLLIRSSR